MGATSGRICIYIETRSLIEYGKCVGNVLFFLVISGKIIRNDILQNRESKLRYLKPLFAESNATTWAVLHTRPAKENDAAVRHFGGGQLLHLFCGCKLWFGEMHRFGSSGCFGNVLIKASLRLRSHRLIFKGKHFHSTQIPHHCALCDFVPPEIFSPSAPCEGAKV